MQTQTTALRKRGLKANSLRRVMRKLSRFHLILSVPSKAGTILPSSGHLSQSCVSVLFPAPPPWAAAAPSLQALALDIWTVCPDVDGTSIFDSCPQSVPPPAHSTSCDQLSVHV